MSAQSALVHKTGSISLLLRTLDILPMEVRKCGDMNRSWKGAIYIYMLIVASVHVCLLSLESCRRESYFMLADSTHLRQI